MGMWAYEEDRKYSKTAYNICDDICIITTHIVYAVQPLSHQWRYGIYALLCVVDGTGVYNYHAV